MAHDNLHCMYMAEQVAKAMAPEVVVATPLNIGVSEHHMEVGPGTLTVRPEIFCEFVFDVCDSLVRSGITNILIMNGHGGNVKPMMYRIEEYRDRLSNIFNNAKMAGGGVGGDAAAANAMRPLLLPLGAPCDCGCSAVKIGDG